MQLTIRTQNALDALFADLEGREEVARDDKEYRDARAICDAMDWLNTTPVASDVFPFVVEVPSEHTSAISASVENVRELAEPDEYDADDITITEEDGR
jgi:hypothetical protein